MSAPEVALATTLLAGIRERDKRIWDLRGNVGGLLAINDAKDDVPHLLAAIEDLTAALERHREWFSRNGFKICGGCLRPAPCPDDPDVIVARALSGKDSSDG
jgi:hypothetical protein